MSVITVKWELLLSPLEEPTDMATEAIDTRSHLTPASPISPCAAHQLTSEQRQVLAVSVLARTETVTELAKQHQVSRQFLYQQAAKGAQALEQAFTSPPDEAAVLFYLPVTKAWLKQVVLALILLCHSSFRGVIEFFQAILDTPLSLGTVHNVVTEAVTLAQQVNAAQELSAVRAGSHDELFQGCQPVLTGIDLDSTYCYLLVPETHRDAETWAIHLLDLAAQGLHPVYTVADGGRGLRAGQALAWPGLPCQGDVFHGLQELTRLVTTLEHRAYAAIAHRDQLERPLQTAKRTRQGRSLSKRVALARQQEATAIQVADEVRILTEWMRQDILSLAGPDAGTRHTLYDFMTDCLQTLESLDPKRLRPVRCTLVNQRDTLLAFAERLDHELEQLAQRFTVPVYQVRQVLSWQTLAPTTATYWARAGELHRQVGKQFHPLQQALLDLRQRLHRASSLVENLNSRLRNYFFLRRHLGSPYLELLRFFLNHHPFQRSHHPQRVGKTPAELLTGQPHPPWLEMLGFTPFRRARQAA